MTKLTPERERLNLFQHGTIKWELTPNAVLETAKRDMRARAHNKAVRRERRKHAKGSPAAKLIAKTRGYAFLSKHVQGAESAADLLRRAIEDRASGMASENVSTLALYTLGKTLWEAARLAEAEEPDETDLDQKTETMELYS